MTGLGASGWSIAATKASLETGLKNTIAYFDKLLTENGELAASAKG